MATTMKRLTSSALALLSLFSATESVVIPSQTTLSLPSSNLASPFLTSWLTAFNSGNKSEIFSFYNTSSASCNETSHFLAEDTFFRSPCQDIFMANWTGGFELVDIERSNDEEGLDVLLQERDGRRYFKAAIGVEEGGGRITKLDVRPIITPLRMIPHSDPKRKLYEKGLQPLTKKLRETIVGEIVAVIRDTYVYPERGEEIIGILEEKMKNGSYDGFDKSEDFAWQLMGDMDGEGDGRYQMFVLFHEPRFEEDERDWGSKMDMYEELEYGFADIEFDIEVIPGKTVATLPITELLPFFQPGVREMVGEKMSSVADADVLIIDLRNCFSVSESETAAFVLSFLFDEPHPLTSLVDRFGVVHNSSSTLPRHQLPAGSKIFGGVKPVYVLTNNRTAWQAEGMAYSLQAYGRAKVVGEHAATRGWWNPGFLDRPICDEEFGKGWWTVYMENLKLVHEVTKSSWNEVGVKSDILAGWEETSEGKAGGHARDVAIAFEKNKGREVQEEL